MTRVVVVGGGIAGLTTALTLAERTAGATGIDLREAGDRLGGKLRTTPFAARPAVDEGADAFLARVPHATALACRLGLELTSPRPAGAAVWHHGIHPLPAGLLLGVPADAFGLARSGLLTWRGKLRAAAEPLLPASDPGDSIGALIRRRFGGEVHTRLVDALVGSIYGADTDRFSLAMVPQLADLAGRGRSLLLSARRMRQASPPRGPVFHAPSGGMGALASAVAAAATAASVTIRTGAPVAVIERDGRGWRADGEKATAVVVATPAAPSAPLLAGAAPELARLLATIDHAGVALVTVAVGGWPARLRGLSGYLVPKDVQRTVTAVSFGSQKWAHWRDDAGAADEVLRISLGRDGLPVDGLDDDKLVDRAVAEVGGHVGLDLQPGEVRVSRWPDAFPQYRPGHRDWLAAVAAATPPGVFLTGASYRGIGVPACIADAETTAASVAAYLAETRPEC